MADETDELSNEVLCFAQNYIFRIEKNELLKYIVTFYDQDYIVSTYLKLKQVYLSSTGSDYLDDANPNSMAGKERNLSLAAATDILSLLLKCDQNGIVLPRFKACDLLNLPTIASGKKSENRGGNNELWEEIRKIKLFVGLPNPLEPSDSPSTQTGQRRQSYAKAASKNPQASKKEEFHPNFQTKEIHQDENTGNENRKSHKESNDFKLVTYGRKRKDKLTSSIVGNGTANIGSKQVLTAVTRRRYYFISKLSKTTTAEELRGHIKEARPELEDIEIVNIPETAEKFGYSSYRVGIFLQGKTLEDPLMNPDVWPKGIVCRNFFFPRTQGTSKHMMQKDLSQCNIGNSESADSLNSNLQTA